MSEPEPEIYFELSKSILRFCAYRRSLYMEDSCLNIYSNTDFYQAIAGSLFCNAILKWCVLFGADSNEHHWKKLSRMAMNSGKNFIRLIRAKITGFMFKKHLRMPEIKQLLM